MQIQVPTCTVAAAARAAITQAGKELEEFKAKHNDNAYNQLVDSARLNGYPITDSVKEEMRAMAERDVLDSLARHPAHNTIEGMEMIIEMCAYAWEREIASVTIDHTDFHHLKDYLKE